VLVHGELVERPAGDALRGADAEVGPVDVHPDDTGPSEVTLVAREVLPEALAEFAFDALALVGVEGPEPGPDGPLDLPPGGVRRDVVGADLANAFRDRVGRAVELLEEELAHERGAVGRRRVGDVERVGGHVDDRVAAGADEAHRVPDVARTRLEGEGGEGGVDRNLAARMVDVGAGHGGVRADRLDRAGVVVDGRPRDEVDRAVALAGGHEPVVEGTRPRLLGGFGVAHVVGGEFVVAEDEQVLAGPEELPVVVDVRHGAGIRRLARVDDGGVLGPLLRPGDVSGRLVVGRGRLADDAWPGGRVVEVAAVGLDPVGFVEGGDLDVRRPDARGAVVAGLGGGRHGGTSGRGVGLPLIDGRRLPGSAVTTAARADVAGTTQSLAQSHVRLERGGAVESRKVGQGLVARIRPRWRRPGGGGRRTEERRRRSRADDRADEQGGDEQRSDRLSSHGERCVRGHR